MAVKLRLGNSYLASSCLAVLREARASRTPFPSRSSRRYTQVSPSRNIPWNTGYTIVTGKRSLTQSSQRRKEDWFSLRLCVRLALWIVEHSCVLTSIATLVYNDDSRSLETSNGRSLWFMGWDRKEVDFLCSSNPWSAFSIHGTRQTPKSPKMPSSTSTVEWRQCLDPTSKWPAHWLQKCSTPRPPKVHRWWPCPNAGAFSTSLAWRLFPPQASYYYF